MSGESLLETTASQASVVEVGVADVLNHAADLLGEWGWCQGGARKGDSYCALGAILFAATGTPPLGQSIDFEEETDLYDRARAAFSSVVPSLAIWNDKPGRTKAEVVAKLRDAAARLDRVVVERATKPADGRVRSGGRT